MPSQLYNVVSDTLLNPIDEVQTTIQIENGNIPDVISGDWIPVFVIRSNGSYEIMHVTAVSGNELTVERGAEGTDALVFDSGVRVEIRPTRQALLESDANNHSVATSTGEQSLAASLDGRVIRVGTVADMLTLDTAALADEQQVSVTSRLAGWAATAKGPQGGGTFVWRADSTDADDGGVVFQVSGVVTGRFHRLLDGYVTPEMYGARGDGTTDDISACQAATQQVGTLVNEYRASGKYLLSQELELNKSNAFYNLAGGHFVGPSTGNEDGALVVVVSRDPNDALVTFPLENIQVRGGRFTPDNPIDNSFGIVDASFVHVEDQIYDLRNGHRGIAIQTNTTGYTFRDIQVHNITTIGSAGVTKNAFNVDLGDKGFLEGLVVNGIMGSGITIEPMVRMSSGGSTKRIKDVTISNVTGRNVWIGMLLQGIENLTYEAVEFSDVRYRGVSISYCDNIAGYSQVKSLASLSEAGSAGVLSVQGNSNLDLRGKILSDGFENALFTGGTVGYYDFVISGSVSNKAITTQSGQTGKVSAKINGISVSDVISAYRSGDVYSLEYEKEGYNVRSLPGTSSSPVEARGSDSPTAGTWVDGSIMWNDNPNAGGEIGWVCVATGTPGSWKPFAAIDA